MSKINCKVKTGQLQSLAPRKNRNFEITWKILARAQPYSPISGVCGLCTQEKWYILFQPELASLNKREEIAGHCFHRDLALLKNS